MFGSGEILMILFVVLILFGGKKLPEFARSLGKGIFEFKKACSGEEENSNKSYSDEQNKLENPHEKITTIQVDHTQER